MRPPRRFTTIQWREMVADYLGGKSMADATRRYGATPDGLRAYMVRNQIPRRSRKGRLAHNRSDPAVERKIVADYQNRIPVHTIAERYGKDRNTITRIVRRCGATVHPVGATRTYALNESAFSTITDESAYWVGFILADGCIHVRNKQREKRAQLVVGLQVRDKDHLEHLRLFLGTDRPLYDLPPNPNRPRGAVVLDICSYRLTDDLMRYGITPRKSRTATVHPDFADNLNFWRGVIDGDGCLSWVANKPYTKRPLISLVGTQAVCSGFAKLVTKRFPGLPVRVRRHKSIFVVQISGVRAAKLAADLYAAGPSLTRKKNLAVAFAQSYIDRPARPWCLKNAAP